MLEDITKFLEDDSIISLVPDGRPLLLIGRRKKDVAEKEQGPAAF